MSGTFEAINPVNKQKISEYQYFTNEKVQEIIDRSWKAFEKQRFIDYKQRATKLRKLGDILDENVNDVAKIITDEMGKPFNEATSEVKKCAKHCRFYADNADELLAPKEVKTEAKHSYVRFDPIGPIYQIVPFNFPLWLAIKAAVPILLVGNTIIHRNARTCPDAGLILEKLMIEAGFDEDEFLNVFTNHNQTEEIIKHPKVRGITFTGSTKSGKVLAELAGKNLKKCVMELGGSDAVVVLEDAELDNAAKITLESRMRNGGQVCTAGKRFIVDEKIYDDFMQKLICKAKELKIGSPYDEEAQLGPMSSESTVKKLVDQVERGIKEGGKVLLEGGVCKEEKFAEGYYFKPCIIEVDEDNCLFKEETFGPIFAVIRAQGEQHALKLANESEYGLGAVVISQDRTRAEKFAKLLEAGTVMINKPVNSDSRLPSGGMKASGFGRECGEWGIYEFANIKTVWVE